MSTLFMFGSIALGIVSIGLTLMLFVLYRGVYHQTHSSFGLALLVFAGAFVAQTALIVYSYWATMPLMPESLTPFLFAIGACETAGLGAILWTASR